ncbi:MAG TPA: gluconate 2-dehydrogenase subunit 3 family protein [Acidobacteriota bacterium]|nr:gluconate 2-dehydrogenase subunit 3 family protein [Acidobacteriota bacterium]
MKRRDLFRRSFLGAVGAALSWASGNAGNFLRAPSREFPSEYDASKLLRDENWKPKFFTEHQNRLFAHLSELIIPETDTPGAKSALVNRFVDHLLAAGLPETQKEVIESLSYIDGEAYLRFGKGFLDISEESQIEILNYLAYPHRLVTWQSNRSEFAGNMHFNRIKEWVARAYWTSEAGMRTLGWDGSPMHGPFTGCPHPENTHR